MFGNDGDLMDCSHIQNKIVLLAIYAAVMAYNELLVNG